jgi:hypothetical protein
MTNKLNMPHKLLALLYFANLCSGKMYSSCDEYQTLNSCVDNPFCQWCNMNTTISNTISNTKYTNTISNTISNITTSNSNTSGVCKPNTECLYNSTECISNNQIAELCNVLEFFVSLSLLFMLFGSIFYISYFTKSILDKYFDIPSDNGEAMHDRKEAKVFLLFIINMLLFVPPIVLWLINKVIFVYYTLSIMGLIILLSFTTITKKYNKYNKTNNQKSAYTQIN